MRGPLGVNALRPAGDARNLGSPLGLCGFRPKRSGFARSRGIAARVRAFPCRCLRPICVGVAGIPTLRSDAPTAPPEFAARRRCGRGLPSFGNARACRLVRTQHAHAGLGLEAEARWIGVPVHHERFERHVGSVAEEVHDRGALSRRPSSEPRAARATRSWSLRAASGTAGPPRPCSARPEPRRRRGSALRRAGTAPPCRTGSPARPRTPAPRARSGRRSRASGRRSRRRWARASRTSSACGRASRTTRRRSPPSSPGRRRRTRRSCSSG